VKPSLVTPSRKKFNLLLVARPAECIARKVSGEDEAGLDTEVLQVSMVLLALQDHMDRKAPREIKVLQDLKAIRALKAPKAILVNPSQPLL